MAPVTVTVNDSGIIFGINFHVRFEDPAMKGQFADLQAGVRAGINLVWKQRLDSALAGRSFTIEPSFTLIDATATRDPKFWLITVRKVNTGAPVTYPGCRLEQPDPTIPTSVTDPMCDGGVMSIPPSHVKLPGVLGHELLHLFGPTFTTIPLRETGRRPDPLGGKDATILREDLGFLFDKLGVYDRVVAGQSASLSSVEIEVRRLRRIVEFGYDPDSLIHDVIRHDFDDKMIESAEDL